MPRCGTLAQLASPKMVRQASWCWLFAQVPAAASCWQLLGHLQVIDIYSMSIQGHCPISPCSWGQYACMLMASLCTRSAVLLLPVQGVGPDEVSTQQLLESRMLNLSDEARRPVLQMFNAMEGLHGQRVAAAAAGKPTGESFNS